MYIKTRKGLDIPIAGKPANKIQSLTSPKRIALSLDAFEDIKFRLLVKKGDLVKLGQPLLENKLVPGYFFVSPGCGNVIEIRRGLKRQISAIIIEIEHPEVYQENKLVDETKEQILSWMLRSGIFPHFRMRPFNLIASPKFLPRSIFIKGLESAPLSPPPEINVDGNEKYFQKGLDLLNYLTPGKVHLVLSSKTTSKAFKEAKNVNMHFAQGPHPISNSSVHIHYIDPILRADQVVWTTDVIGVITLGKMAIEGHYFTDRIISIAGNGILSEKRSYYKARAGHSIEDLAIEKIPDAYLRYISGNPLTGRKVELTDFLGFYDLAFCAIPENINRKFLHFLRFGLNKYTATKAYFSGHFSSPKEGYEFDTNQHGEERAFIDPSVYDRVMPLKIPTVPFIKAILAEDFELAEQLGILEVDEEYFALASFICPSKIEIAEIVKSGLRKYSKEMGY